MSRRKSDRDANNDVIHGTIQSDSSRGYQSNSREETKGRYPQVTNRISSRSSKARSQASSLSSSQKVKEKMKRSSSHSLSKNQSSRKSSSQKSKSNRFRSPTRGNKKQRSKPKRKMFTSSDESSKEDNKSSNHTKMNKFKRQKESSRSSLDSNNSNDSIELSSKLKGKHLSKNSGKNGSDRNSPERPIRPERDLNSRKNNNYNASAIGDLEQEERKELSLIDSDFITDEDNSEESKTSEKNQHIRKFENNEDEDKYVFFEREICSENIIPLVKDILITQLGPNNDIYECKTGKYLVKSVKNDLKLMVKIKIIKKYYEENKETELRKPELVNNYIRIISDIIYEAQSQNANCVNQSDAEISRNISNDETLRNLFEACKSKSVNIYKNKFHVEYDVDSSSQSSPTEIFICGFNEVRIAKIAEAIKKLEKKNKAEDTYIIKFHKFIKIEGEFDHEDMSTEELETLLPHWPILKTCLKNKFTNFEAEFIQKEKKEQKNLNNIYLEFTTERLDQEDATAILEDYFSSLTFRVKNVYTDIISSNKCQDKRKIREGALVFNKFVEEHKILDEFAISINYENLLQNVDLLVLQKQNKFTPKMEETKIGLIGEGKHQFLVFVNYKNNEDSESNAKVQISFFEDNFKILCWKFENMIKIELNKKLNKEYKEDINKLINNITEILNYESDPIKCIFMEFGDICKYYFISDIKEDRKLDEVVAFEENLIAECFINIIDEATENIFGVRYKTIQNNFELIRDELEKQGLTEVLQREFKLDMVKAEMDGEILGFKVIGQNINIRVIQADVQNGKQGNKSFVFDSIACVLKELIIKRIKFDCNEDKYFRCFDSERAKKIIEVENQCVLFNDKKFKIKIESKFNTFIYNFIVCQLGTNFLPTYKDPDDIFNINNRFLCVASILSGSNKSDKNEWDITRTIFANNKHKIVSKLVDSSLALLDMKFDSDGEYKFTDVIKRVANLENGLNANIPAYLQLFCTIQEKENELTNNEQYDKYVWYYEYIRDDDKDVKDRLLNRFKVIRFETSIDDDFKIIQELEQNYYEYKNSNENKINFKITFTDSQNNNRECVVKFCSKGRGVVGSIAFSQTHLKCRNLFRYPDYKQSKFETEDSLIVFGNIRLFRLGYCDPYEGKRPVPVNKSFKFNLNDDLNHIGVGKIQSKNKEKTYSAYIKINQSENIERKKEQKIYDCVQRLEELGENIRAPQLNDKMSNNGDILIWRLATSKGSMLKCMTPKWIQVLDEIENYAMKKSGVNMFFIEEKIESIDEEK